MSRVMGDYHLLSFRYPPPRPSVYSCTLHFSKLSLVSSASLQSPSFLCKAISLSQSQAEDPEESRRLRHDAFQQFLLKQCGFSQSELTTLMTKKPILFRSRSTDRAQAAVQLFIDSGFTAQQVRKIIIQNPSLLWLKVDQQLKPKIELLTEVAGIDPQDLGRTISQQPRILGLSLSKKLKPKIEYLIKVFGSSDKLSKAIKKAPVLLNCDGHISENLEKKLKYMENIGLTEDEVAAALERDSRFLALSMDKIKKNMEFLTRVAGFMPNIVLKYPSFLLYSVENRMNPRHKVYKYLTEMGAVSLSLPSMFILSEERYAEKCLKSPSVAELYKKYKGKSVDLDLL